MYHVFQVGLAMLMSRMYHEAPKEFKFYPETWVLPAEMNDFRCVFVYHVGHDHVHSVFGQVTEPRALINIIALSPGRNTCEHTKRLG